MLQANSRACSSYLPHRTDTREIFRSWARVLPHSKARDTDTGFTFLHHKLIFRHSHAKPLPVHTSSTLRPNSPLPAPQISSSSSSPVTHTYKRAHTYTPRSSDSPSKQCVIHTKFVANYALDIAHGIPVSNASTRVAIRASSCSTVRFGEERRSQTPGSLCDNKLVANRKAKLCK